MTHRWGLWLIIVGLCGVIAFAFARPHLMVAPGPLIPAHNSIANNCFACHSPFMGASADRCSSCHKIADIGIRNSKGIELPKVRDAIRFHQSLIEPDCMACHTDHAGPLLVKSSRPKFKHSLLKPNVRTQCVQCHRAPETPIHANANRDCAACHNQSGWKPSTFNHNRFFALSGPHNATCITCHKGGDYKLYTCFGCHEHQPEQIRAEHAEEGIRNIQNCVRCHRNGSGEGSEDGEDGDDD